MIVLRRLPLLPSDNPVQNHSQNRQKNYHNNPDQLGGIAVKPTAQNIHQCPDPYQQQKQTEKDYQDNKQNSERKRHIQ